MGMGKPNAIVVVDGVNGRFAVGPFSTNVKAAEVACDRYGSFLIVPWYWDGGEDGGPMQLLREAHDLLSDITKSKAGEGLNGLWDRIYGLVEKLEANESLMGNAPRDSDKTR